MLFATSLSHQILNYLGYATVQGSLLLFGVGVVLCLRQHLSSHLKHQLICYGLLSFVWVPALFDSTLQPLVDLQWGRFR
jgi:hypothetical protein